MEPFTRMGISMPSPNLSVSPATLQHLGSRLTETVEAVATGAAFPGAAGAEAYKEITSAVDDFEGDRANTVARLREQTGGLGQKTFGIGRLMGEHDASLAESLRPGEA